MPTAGTGPRVRRLDHPDADVRPRALGLPRGRPVLAVFGSADALATDLAAAVLPVLRAVLAAAASADAVVITAGADVGVTHLLGLAAESLDGRWPRMVGVAPSGRVAAEDAEPADGEVRLNVNHDTAVLVPGSKWGEELPALFRAVDAVAGSKRPALAVLIGGGDLARTALVDHLGRDRPLLVIAGTGGLADEIARGAASRTADPAPTAAGVAPAVPTATAGATAASTAPAAHAAPSAGFTQAAPDPAATAAGVAPVAPTAASATAGSPAAPGTAAFTGPVLDPRADVPAEHDDLAVLVRSGQVARCTRATWTRARTRWWPWCGGWWATGPAPSCTPTCRRPRCGRGCGSGCPNRIP